MFRTEDLTPGDLAEFQTNRVPIATNLLDLEVAVKDFYGRDFAMNAGYRINELIRKWKGEKLPWSCLQGAKILDVGSGSSGNLLTQPYFARLCAVNGAVVMAIDQGFWSDLDQKLFSSISVDIVPYILEDRLVDIEGLDAGSFDIVNSTNFIGSNPDPNIFEGLKRRRQKVPDIYIFENIAAAQMTTLLADGGIVDVDLEPMGRFREVYYRRIDDKVVRELVPY